MCSTDGKPLVVEQIIRPTGLLDPQITIQPLKNQIDDTIEACRQRIEAGERILVTTLTKRTAEDLTDYLSDVGLKVRYLHSDIDTIERVEILRALRAAEFDILVGINLLREGLDLPEVSLVCILDADKEGYLRSQTSLIQTAGRAARHVNGMVILFADTITQSMRKLLEVTEYRRERQIEYNTMHGITPQSVRRAVQESLHMILKGKQVEESVIRESGRRFQHQRGAARTGSGDGGGGGEPGVRKGGAVARSDHGAEERHRHLQDRTQAAQAGAVFQERRWVGFVARSGGGRGDGEATVVEHPPAQSQRRQVGGLNAGQGAALLLLNGEATVSRFAFYVFDVPLAPFGFACSPPGGKHLPMPGANSRPIAIFFHPPDRGGTRRLAQGSAFLGVVQSVRHAAGHGGAHDSSGGMETRRDRKLRLPLFPQASSRRRSRWRRSSTTA